MAPCRPQWDFLLVCLHRFTHLFFIVVRALHKFGLRQSAHGVSKHLGDLFGHSWSQQVLRALSANTMIDSLPRVIRVVDFVGVKP